VTTALAGVQRSARWSVITSSGACRRCILRWHRAPVRHGPVARSASRSIRFPFGELVMSFYNRQANNAFGVFLICSIFLVLTVAIDSNVPNEATGTVQGLLIVIGLAALAANMWCRIKAVNWSKY
jgi:hypothetical protein